MEEIRTRMSEIEDPRHQSYVKYPLADILNIIMCSVLCGLDTLGDLAIYAKNKEEFLKKELGIEKVPSKATFARILSMIDGKQIGDAIIDVLHSRFGTAGEVIAVDGKAICSTANPRNPHSALQILSAYVTSSGIILAQESIHEKTDDCRFLSENAHKSMNALRKFALAVHKNFLAAHHKKSSIKVSMLSALLDHCLLLDLLHFL